MSLVTSAYANYSLSMLTRHSLRIAVVSLIASLAGFSSVQAQRHGAEPQVTTGSPAGLVKKIEPEYPIGFVTHGAKGRGRFRLTINAKSGLVDEVKIVKSLAVKALLQWQFKPGTPSSVEVPVEFDIRGGNRILH